MKNNFSQILNVVLLVVLFLLVAQVASSQPTTGEFTLVGVILEDENGDRVDAYVKIQTDDPDVPTPESTVLPTIEATSFPKPTETPDGGRCAVRATTNVKLRTEPRIADETQFDLALKGEIYVVQGQYAGWWKLEYFPTPPDFVWSVKDYWELVDPTIPACQEIPVIPNPFP